MRAHTPIGGVRNVAAFAWSACASLVAQAAGADLPTGPGAVVVATAAAGFCDRFLASDVLAALNAARAQARQCGAKRLPSAPAVGWNGALTRAAHRHSSDMAVRGFFSHTGSDGSDVGSRAGAADYGWTSVAENIAGGPASVDAVMDGWLSSPGHCANIMGAGFREVGLACVTQPGSRYTRYWTLVLARP